MDRGLARAVSSARVDCGAGRAPGPAALERRPGHGERIHRRVSGGPDQACDQQGAAGRVDGLGRARVSADRGARDPGPGTDEPGRVFRPLPAVRDGAAGAGVRVATGHRPPDRFVHGVSPHPEWRRQDRGDGRFQGAGRAAKTGDDDGCRRPAHGCVSCSGLHRPSDVFSCVEGGHRTGTYIGPDDLVPSGAGPG